MSKIALSGNASGTGTLTVAAPNTNSDYTLTLPVETGTVTTSGSTPTFTGAVTAPGFIPNSSTVVTDGLYLPAASTVALSTGTTERMRIDSSGNVTQYGGVWNIQLNGTTYGSISAASGDMNIYSSNSGYLKLTAAGTNMLFSVNGSERARITSNGDLCVGKTSTNTSTAGAAIYATGLGYFVVSSSECIEVNRLSSDGTLISFRQDGTQEGTISVSGTTVSYNGGHLSRWAQTQGPKDDTLVKGTVLSNLDEMNVYINPETGEPVPNEQLNKVKVSDVEGDVNVAGVFVNWSYDEQHQVDEINMAMTGDMIIRIAQGVVVQKGDLLMSAGDGTAKPQGDDIIRSKTVAKVTSNHVTCTYEDGSYCVPCVLMAC